jgi:hypothetical protein
MTSVDCFCYLFLKKIRYAGDKVKIAKLKWLPKVEEPHWLKESQRYIRKNRKDIRMGIRQRRRAAEEKKEKSKRKREILKEKKSSPIKPVKSAKKRAKIE